MRARQTIEPTLNLLGVSVVDFVEVCFDLEERWTWYKKLLVILLRFTEIAWLTTKHEYLSGLALLHVVLDTERSEDNLHNFLRGKALPKWSQRSVDALG